MDLKTKFENFGVEIYEDFLKTIREGADDKVIFEKLNHRYGAYGTIFYSFRCLLFDSEMYNVEQNIDLFRLIVKQVKHAFATLDSVEKKQQFDFFRCICLSVSFNAESEFAYLPSVLKTDIAEFYKEVLVGSEDFDLTHSAISDLSVVLVSGEFLYAERAMLTSFLLYEKKISELVKYCQYEKDGGPLGFIILAMLRFMKSEETGNDTNIKCMEFICRFEGNPPEAIEDKINDIIPSLELLSKNKDPEVMHLVCVTLDVLTVDLTPSTVPWAKTIIETIFKMGNAFRHHVGIIFDRLVNSTFEYMPENYQEQTPDDKELIVSNIASKFQFFIVLLGFDSCETCQNYSGFLTFLIFCFQCHEPGYEELRAAAYDLVIAILKNNHGALYINRDIIINEAMSNLQDGHPLKERSICIINLIELKWSFLI